VPVSALEMLGARHALFLSLCPDDPSRPPRVASSASRGLICRSTYNANCLRTDFLALRSIPVASRAQLAAENLFLKRAETRIHACRLGDAVESLET